MSYLGVIYKDFENEYVIKQKPKKLKLWPKPIRISEKIPSEKLDKVLKILNGEGNFSIKKCNEVSVPEGSRKNEVASFYTIFGEIKILLTHEGPSFIGPNWRTKGPFSFYRVEPETDIAILVQQSTINYKTGSYIRGTIYLLERLMSEPANCN